MKVKVYCDNGVLPKDLKKIKSEGLIDLIYFPYENRNRNITQFASPSKASWDDFNITYNESTFTWDNIKESKKYNSLLKLFDNNPKHIKDILHLDSAYKSNCAFFITSDKDDIYNKRHAIKELLNIEVCYQHNLEPLLTLLSSATI